MKAFSGWKHFVEVMKDESKEDSYKKIVDELLEAKTLSLYSKGCFYVVWDNAVIVNPRSLPYKPSPELYFTNEEDAKGYAEALYPNAKIEIRRD